MYVNKKEERTAQTRQLLEGVARELFEARGFTAISADEIVARAGLTRGALYYHYNGKEGLFEAVVEAAMQRLHAAIAKAGSAASDPVSALKLGVRCFLKLGVAPGTQRILFIDAPVVMGWQRWRELDGRYGFGMLQQVVSQAMASGQMREQPVALVAHLLLSAMIEAAMVIARADQKPAVRADTERLLDQFVDSLR